MFTTSELVFLFLFLQHRQKERWGEPPHHAISFKSCLEDAMNGNKESLKGLKFTVMAMGSSSYENFCTFGKFCDNAMEKLGGQRLAPLALGDETRGQDRAFRNWTKLALVGSCEAFDITIPSHVEEKWPFSRTRIRKASWVPHSFRTTNNIEGRRNIGNGRKCFNTRTTQFVQNE